MPPEDFAAALTNRLRRQGVDFRPKDVKTFAAEAWTQGGRSPDLDAWAERFLAVQAQGGFARPLAGTPRRFGLRAAGKFLLLGAAVSLTLGVVVGLVCRGLELNEMTLVTSDQLNFFLGTCFFLAPCFLVSGVILTLIARLDRAEPRFVKTARLSPERDGGVASQGRAEHWFVRTALGVILAAICGGLVASAAFGISGYLVSLIHPESWILLGIVIWWLPGAGGGAILGGILEAMKVRHSWLIGGCLGGLLVGGFPLLDLL